MCDYTFLGFEYKYHKHDGIVAMHSQFLDGVWLSYEVTILRWNSYEERYYRPTEKVWGKFGWTFKSSQRAEEKYKQLIKELT